MPPWEKYGNRSQAADPVVTPLPRNPYDVEKDKREEGRSSRGEVREDTRVGLSQEENARAERRGTYSDLMQMRGAYDSMPGVKEYRAVVPLFTSALKTTPDGAGDNALIYAYAKVMDPASVVRESEMTMAGNTGSVFDTATAQLKKQFGIEGGGQLSPAQREGLRKQMLGKITEMNRAYNAQRSRYRADAQAFGFDPERVIGTHDGQQFLPEIQAALTPKQQSMPTGIGGNDEDGLTGSVTDTGSGYDPGLEVSVTDDRPGPQGGGGQPLTPYQSSYLGQVMSGANEGLASTLGAPVDLAAMGLNLIPKGVNALTNSNIPEITNPFLGSEWIADRFKDMGAIYEPSNDPRKQFTRRTGQSMGAAFVPMAATLGAYSQAAKILGTALAGGVGAATAQQAFPGNPAAEFAGEVLGSGLGAGTLATANRFAATRKALEQVPSRDQLRDQATNLYNVAESRGIVAGPNVTSNLAGRFNQIADDQKLRWPDGRMDPNYTRAGAGVGMMDAHAGQSIDPRQIQMLRENLTDAVGATEGKERRIAKQFLDAFDEETIPLAPELSQARNVASRYLQSDEINRARNLAEARAGQYSNGGMENALRTDFRKLDRDITTGKANFNPAAAAAVQKVARGSAYSNAMRRLGKLAPTGAVSTGISAGVPFMIGNAIGGPGAGAAASMGTMGLGVAAKKAAERATLKDAAMADALARNGGPLKLPPRLSPTDKKFLIRMGMGQGTQYIPKKKR